MQDRVQKALDYVRSRSGGVLSSRYGKEECLIYFRTLPVMRWSLLLVYKEKEILSDLVRMQRINMLIVVVSLLLLGLSLYQKQAFRASAVATVESEFTIQHQVSAMTRLYDELISNDHSS
ncbi:MAG TPA: hypothetical protein PK773_00890 [Aminivibrio sp.]|nr:hypothetical protein [Aminivibrio sp.]